LVKEYLDLIGDFQIPPLADSAGKGELAVHDKSETEMRLAGAGGGNDIPVADTKSAKSCTDVFFIERIVYSPAISRGQMAVCSVPGDTISLFHFLFFPLPKPCPFSRTHVNASFMA
jgi:hypothetical protein